MVLGGSLWCEQCAFMSFLGLSTPVLLPARFLQPDQGNHVIRRVSASGIISTIGTLVSASPSAASTLNHLRFPRVSDAAGIPRSAGYSGEGLPALASLLSSPVSMAPYRGGYVIVNRGTFRIVQLWPNGTLTTAAGIGTSGLSGDGGPATAAAIFPQWGVVAADPAGPGGGFVWCEQGAYVEQGGCASQSWHSPTCAWSPQDRTPCGESMSTAS